MYDYLWIYDWWDATHDIESQIDYEDPYGEEIPF